MSYAVANRAAAVDSIGRAISDLAEWIAARSPVTKYRAMGVAILVLLALAVLHTFFLNLGALALFLYLVYQGAHHVHNNRLTWLWRTQKRWEELHPQLVFSAADFRQAYDALALKIENREAFDSWEARFLKQMQAEKWHGAEPKEAVENVLLDPNWEKASGALKTRIYYLLSEGKNPDVPFYTWRHITLFSAFALLCGIAAKDIDFSLPRLASPASPTPSISEQRGTRIVKMLKTQGKTRVYEMNNGDIVTRVGGSLSWRDNNPGNLKFEYRGDADKTRNVRRSKSQALAKARKLYPGVVDLDQWGSLVFASVADGRAAKTKLLRKKHGFRTVEQMLPRYAISDYSGTANHDAYAGAIYRHAESKGINLKGRRIRDLADFEMQALMDGMQRFEGWKEGKTHVKPAAPILQCRTVSSGSGYVYDKPRDRCTGDRLKLKIARLADKLPGSPTITIADPRLFNDKAASLGHAHTNTMVALTIEHNHVWLKKTRFLTAVLAAERLCEALKLEGKICKH